MQNQRYSSRRLEKISACGRKTRIKFSPENSDRNFLDFTYIHDVSICLKNEVNHRGQNLSVRVRCFEIVNKTRNLT